LTPICSHGGRLQTDDRATGSKTVSQTITRFNIEGTDMGSSFTFGTNFIFSFVDTLGSDVNYHAADPVAWSTTINGKEGLPLNFYNNGAAPMF
jgi:hypothetical protein